MPGDVNSPRPYNSPARRERAAATRARVLAAADKLFHERGYGSTTTAAVARAAGVSEASVFVGFGSKAGLLVALVGATVAGTADEGPLRERPEWRRLADDQDPARALAAFVAIVRRAHDRTWRLLAMVRAATEGDAELAGLATRAGQARRQDCNWFATEVLGLDDRRRHTSTFVDVLWAQTSVDLYRLLTVELGWSSRRYETWLTKTLSQQIPTS